MNHISMTNFVWFDEYRVGDDVIDRQHKYLFVLANEIIDSVNDTQRIYHKIITFHHYLLEHFKVEESLMRQRNYADYKKHITEHAEIEKKLSEIGMSLIIGDANHFDVEKLLQRWRYESFHEKDLLLADLLPHKWK